MLNGIAKTGLKKAMGLDTGNSPKNTRPTVSSLGNLSYNNSPLGHMDSYKYSYATKQYPLDIQQRSDLGHYMMFYINTINEPGRPGMRGDDTKDRFDASNPIFSTGSVTKGVEIPKNIGDPMTMIQEVITPKYSSTGAKGASNPASVNGVTRLQRKNTEGVRIERRKARTGLNSHKQRTKRTEDAVVLYMPNQIVANYNSAYKEGEIGGILGAGIGAGRKFSEEGGVQSFQNLVDAGKSVMSGGNVNWDALAGSLVDTGEAAQKSVIPYLKQVALDAGLNLANTAAKGLGLGDLRGGYDKLSNRQINNFLESMFSGIGFRKFSWLWKFQPHSPEEAVEVDEIIRLFKFHMLPELPMNDFGRYFKTPSEFDIHYMFRGEENTFLNKLATCVCLNCDVNYTPTQYQTLRPIADRPGAPMAEIELKLDFMETELITKEKILEGF